MSEVGKLNFDVINDTFIKNRGNVAACAKALNIKRTTLHKYIKDHPGLQKALDDAREIHSVDELELAISLNYMFMQDWKNNPSLASKHVIFTLERKGHTRGYLKDLSDVSVNKDIELKFDESMAHVLSLLGSDRKIDDNNISNETKS